MLGTQNGHQIDLAELWRRYRGSRDSQARDKLVRHYLPFVQQHANMIVQRIPRNVTADDLVSAGSVALLWALDQYDPGKNIKFESYAGFRIRGAMLDELRGVDSAPRLVRKQLNRIMAWSRLFCQEHGRDPQDHEIAQGLGISEHELQIVRIACSQRNIDTRYKSNDEDSGSWSFQDHTAPDPAVEAERLDAFRALEARLSGRIRDIVKLRFFDGLTMLETAKRIGISESRVSQLLKRFAEKFGLKDLTFAIASRPRLKPTRFKKREPVMVLRGVVQRMRQAADRLDEIANQILLVW